MFLARPIRLALLIVFLIPGLPHKSLAADSAAGISINAKNGLPEFLDNDVRLSWTVPGDPEASQALQELQYDVVDSEIDGGTRRTLTAREMVDGRRLIHRFDTLAANGDAESYTLQLDLDVPAAAAIELSADYSFIPERLPGFGAVYGNVLAIVVDAGGQQELEILTGDFANHSVEASDWFGIRSRFQTALLRSDINALNVRIETGDEDLPRLIIVTLTATTRLKLDLYAGPVDLDVLRSVDPALGEMMFAALWDWLRVLCFGMAWLLTRIHNVVGNVGLAIILLSASVKILMLPLTRIADRWQDAVNRTQALLQPRIDAIKKEFKGEEAHNRILAVYKEHDVSPMHTFRSLAGFLILIPVFIAAFDVLGESLLLNGTSFLWIADLAKPDRAAALPWALPFFGEHLNLLPFLMTGVTLYTSWLQTDPSLTPELLRKQRIRLYLMAGVFFLLFYTFPAGMVLYWTTNNVLHLMKVQFGRLQKNAG